jgi:hypothetical protein
LSGHESQTCKYERAATVCTLRVDECRNARCRINVAKRDATLGSTQRDFAIDPALPFPTKRSADAIKPSASAIRIAVLQVEVAKFEQRKLRGFTFFGRVCCTFEGFNGAWITHARLGLAEAQPHIRAPWNVFGKFAQRRRCFVIESGVFSGVGPKGKPERRARDFSKDRSCALACFKWAAATEGDFRGATFVFEAAGNDFHAS